MDRVTGSRTVDIGGGRRGFRDRNLSAGIDGTTVPASWLNPVQEELMNVMSAGGIAPDPNDWGTVLKALYALFGGTGSLLSPGFMRLPGRLLLQYGSSISTGTGTTAVLWPTAYPNVVRSIVITEQNASGWGNPPQPTIYGAQGGDRFGFIAHSVRIGTNGVPSYQSGLAFNYMSIGS